MLPSERLAGVAPEMNLRNPSCAGVEAHKQGIQPSLKPQDRRHQKSKAGVAMVKKVLMSCKKYL